MDLKHFQRGVFCFSLHICNPARDHSNSWLSTEPFHVQSHLYIRRGNRRLSLAALPGLPATSWGVKLPLLANTRSGFYFSFRVIVTRIDIHLQNGDVSVYWFWLLLDISAVSVVIVIIAICDMPRQEFSVREHVYIHNTYMKSRKSCAETRKFRIKFPGWRVANPSTIRELAKRFKEIGCVRNINVNPRCHVLKEETLDDIGERLEHAPKNL